MIVVVCGDGGDGGARTVFNNESGLCVGGGSDGGGWCW